MKNPWLKHYAKRVPHNITYPEIPIHRFLTDTVAKHPDYIAYTFNESDTSYRELNEKVNKFALILQNAGLKKGDRVALIMVNSPTYVIAFFAVMKLGAIVANISVGIQGEELTRCLNNSGAKLAVTLDIFAPNLYKVVKNTEVKNVILHSVFGLEKKIPMEEGMPEPQVFLELLASVESAAEPAVEISPADVAVLQYTSGYRRAQGGNSYSLQYCGKRNPVRYMDGSTGCRQRRGDVYHSLFPRFRNVFLSFGFRAQRIPDDSSSPDRFNGHPFPDEDAGNLQADIISGRTQPLERDYVTSFRGCAGSILFHPGGSQRRGAPCALGP
jgi:hypothetical protein